MSLKTMNAVWEKSAQEGNKLLILLALADNANDLGFCFPHIDFLIRKTRLSKATVLRNLQALEATGELIVVHRRTLGNRYIVTLGLSADEVWQSIKTFCGLSKAAAEDLFETWKRTPQGSLSISLTLSKSHGDTYLEPKDIRVVLTSVSTTADAGVRVGEDETQSVTASPPSSEQSGRSATHKSTGRNPTRSALFWPVARRLFGVEDKAARAIGGRIGRVITALLQVETTPEEFEKACQWWAGRNLILPRDPEKAATMILDYRQQAKAATNGGGYKLVIADRSALR